MKIWGYLGYLCTVIYIFWVVQNFIAVYPSSQIWVLYAHTHIYIYIYITKRPSVIFKTEE